MESDPRSIELLTDMVMKQDAMLKEQQRTNAELHELISRVEGLDDQQAKTNLGIGELRLSVMRLADELHDTHELRERVQRLESQVFGQR
jgi:hypothetical protein